MGVVFIGAMIAGALIGACVMWIMVVIACSHWK